MATKPVHSVVLDTSPILTNIPSISSLLTKCEQLYTVQAVIDEIKDVNARSRLEITTLPFLDIRAPKPESIRFISQFARKTGDYAVLSTTDILVLALAYELECEQNEGDWRLRKTPGQKGLNDPSPNKRDAATEGQNERIPAKETLSPTKITSAPDMAPNLANHQASKEPSNVPEVAESNHVSTDFDNLRLTESETEEVAAPGATPEGSGSEQSEPDSEGWITPSNLKKQQAKDQGASAVPLPEDGVMKVATITNDFAMQVST